MSAAGQLDALKGAVARHIDRFAFREAPLAFGWQDTLNGQVTDSVVPTGASRSEA